MDRASPGRTPATDATTRPSSAARTMAYPRATVRRGDSSARRASARSTRPAATCARAVAARRRPAPAPSRPEAARAATRPRAGPSRGASRSTRSRARSPRPRSARARSADRRPSASAARARSRPRPRRRAAPWSPSRTSRASRLGSTAAAAALGVDTRRSATSSHSVTSRSWPTAETTGVVAEATARQTASLLKAIRSSSDPPPRATTITSTSSRASRWRQRAHDRRRRRLALHRHAHHQHVGPREAGEGVGEEVVPRGAVRARHQAHPPRQERDRPAAAGVEQALGVEPAPQLLDLGAQQPLPRQLEALHPHRDRAAGAPELDPPVGLHERAVARLVGQAVVDDPVHGGVERRAAAQPEVHLAAAPAAGPAPRPRARTSAGPRTSPPGGR